MCMISHKYKFIFIHIPKTGGSSIRQSLSAIAPRQDRAALNRFGAHITATDMKKRVRPEVWDTYFKFAFVRNPYDRLVSLWYYVRRIRPRIRNPGNWIEAYMRKYPTITSLLANPSFSTTRLQWEYVYDEHENLQVDYVGRFERLALDWNYVLGRINIPQISLRYQKKSHHKQFRYYYNPQSIATVTELVEKDLRLFNYSFR